MDQKRIILPEYEQNAFMRWLLTQHDVRDFSQYLGADGWEVTALFVNDEFFETLYERGSLRAVSRELYNRYRLAHGRGGREDVTLRLLDSQELCLN